MIVRLSLLINHNQEAAIIDLTEKRKLENKEQMDKKKALVLEAALEVFIEKGIENTKMTDIAQRAEVGVASVYRYFQTKTEIVIEVGILYWEKEINRFYAPFLESAYLSLNGIQKVSRLLDVFIEIYLKDPGFYKFIEEFDNFVVKEKVPAERLATYEQKILALMPIMFEALEQGKEDGSIQPSLQTAEFYMTITQTFISLAQKLILRNIILESDQHYDRKNQLELIKKMALSYIDNQTFGGNEDE